MIEAAPSQVWSLSEPARGRRPPIETGVGGRRGRGGGEVLPQGNLGGPPGGGEYGSMRLQLERRKGLRGRRGTEHPGLPPSDPHCVMGAQGQVDVGERGRHSDRGQFRLPTEPGRLGAGRRRWHGAGHLTSPGGLSGTLRGMRPKGTQQPRTKVRHGGRPGAQGTASAPQPPALAEPSWCDASPAHSLGSPLVSSCPLALAWGRGRAEKKGGTPESKAGAQVHERETLPSRLPSAS